MFLASQHFFLIAFLLPTTACLTVLVSAFSLPDPLHLRRLPACVPTLDLYYYELCFCLLPVGFTFSCLDCLYVYHISEVKLVNCSYLCLRVVLLDPHTILHPLQYELAKMEPANAETVLAALRAQGKRIVQTEESLHAVGGQMSGMSAQIGQLSEQFGQLMAQLSSPPVQQLQTPAPSSDPAPGAASALLPAPVTYVRPLHLSHPEKFSGESGDCRSFLVQCGLHYELQAQTFPTERSRVAYMISYLTGQAEKWATAE